MDLQQRIEQAARAAIAALALEGVEYDAQYRHQDSERVDVHFREGTKYFTVQVLFGGHPDYPAKTNVEVLTEQIITGLRKQQEN